MSNYRARGALATAQAAPTVPEISRELVEWLQRTHPQRVINKSESYEDAIRRAGFQDCIDLLTFWQSQQEQAGAGVVFTDDADDPPGTLSTEPGA